MKRITVEMLKQIDACEDQVELFEQVFPKGAPVSMRSLAKAQKAGLDVFFAERLLTGPAWAEYEKVTGPALAEYEKVGGPAWAEYEKVSGASLGRVREGRGASPGRVREGRRASLGRVREGHRRQRATGPSSRR